MDYILELADFISINEVIISPKPENINTLDQDENTKNLDRTGRAMGLEPTNGGTTNRCLNHLATLAICFLCIYYNILFV